MLEELRNCRSYSGLEKQMKILDVLKNGNKLKNDLELFFSSDVDIRSNLADDLVLLKMLGYIETIQSFHDLSYKLINNNFSKQSLSDALFTLIIKKNIGNLVIIEDGYFISIDSEFHALRNLLYIEDLITRSHLPRIFKVNSIENRYLKKYLKPISKEQFKIKLERNEEIGLKAEEYVKVFEENRLGGSKVIQHISIKDNNAGYDILSYIDENSTDYDKFIEVKCFSELKRVFFISKNEIITSEKFGDNYFLYLINSNFKEEPLIIRNPAKKIFGNSDCKYEIESRKYDISSLNL